MRFWHNLSREQQDTLFLLGVIAAVIAPHAQHLPMWTTLLTLGMLAYRAFIAVKLKPLPSRWLTVALLTIGVAATYYTFRTIFGREAGVSLITLLIALKTLELKARRDAFVVFFLGFFAVLTNFLYSQSLLTGLMMLLAVAGLFTALVSAHMPVGNPPLRNRMLLSLKMMGLGTPLAIVLFVLFPRASGPLWGMPGDAQAARTGLSSRMSVGDLAEIALDDSVAFRVEFEGSAPPANLLYFRGPVLSSFDGRRWTPLRSSLPTSERLKTEIRPKGAAIKHTITLEPTQREWIFAIEHPREIPRISGYEITQLPNMLAYAHKPIVERLRYSLSSLPQTETGPLSRDLALQDYLELPRGFNPRSMQYALDLRARPEFANASADVLARHLTSQINSSFTYTLAPGIYGQNSVDEFWFDRKQGFCEHFAQAFVVMMRGMDVPARVVTGYQGAEFNRFDGTYIVRQSHAHAWAEYWMPGRGWVRADPTAAVAPERINNYNQTLGGNRSLFGVGPAVNSGLIAGMRSAWDAVNNSWNQWILSYSNQRQLNLLKNLGFDAPDWGSLAVLMIVLAALATAVAGAWLVWDAPRRDPWAKLFGQGRKLLAKSGVQSTDASGPRGLLPQVEQLPNHAAWREWLLLMEQLRYSPHPTAGYTQAQQHLKRLINGS